MRIVKTSVELSVLLYVLCEHFLQSVFSKFSKKFLKDFNRSLRLLETKYDRAVPSPHVDKSLSLSAVLVSAQWPEMDSTGGCCSDGRRAGRKWAALWHRYHFHLRAVAVSPGQETESASLAQTP